MRIFMADNYCQSKGEEASRFAAQAGLIALLRQQVSFDSKHHALIQQAQKRRVAKATIWNQEPYDKRHAIFQLAHQFKILFP